MVVEITEFGVDCLLFSLLWVGACLLVVVCLYCWLVGFACGSLFCLLCFGLMLGIGGFLVNSVVAW